MRTKFVIAAWLGMILASVAVSGADPRALIGATREEILARFGEPKSQIVAGNREVLIFATERVVLRDNRAIELEELPPEAPPPPPPAAAPATDAPANENPDEAAAPSSVAPANGRARATDTTPSAEEGGAPRGSSAPASPPPPEVVIKSVRPPSHTATPSSEAPPATVAAPAAKPTADTATPPPPATNEVSSARERSSTAPQVVRESTAHTPAGALAPTTPQAGNTEATTAATETAAVAATSDTSAAAPAESTTEASVPSTAATAPAPEVQAAANTATTAQSRRAPVVTNPAPAARPAGSGRFVAVATAIIVAGIGYLYWRRRQRAALLAATAVSRSPFATTTTTTAASAAPVGSRFTPEILEKLEWKRFEELVAAYYNKTGVVATRTKTGPMTPVHIRISWKGEQRPFACVQCHAHPAGLIDARPVQTLVDALAAEDIRRGYIVTSGKFGVPARDLAEEKHITLLSGDLFLEKLNALPEPARAELLREAVSGDYTTPTCPTCDAKMSRSIGESVWTCPQCGTTLARA